MNAPLAIEVTHLVKTFGATRAVDGISFTVPAGSVFGFVGPNGAGKTTTLRIMATLDEPDSGDVLLCGQSVHDDPREIRRRIGFMPDALPSIADITAHEYLDFFGRAYGLRGVALAYRLEEVEDFTGLRPLREKTLAALSKGMKQRVCLARAIIHDPAVLLLDEPAAGLDPRARVELRDMVRQLAAMGKTILISSHILAELAEMCGGVIIMEQGRLLSQGTLEAVAMGTRPDAKVCEVSISVVGGRAFPRATAHEDVRPPPDDAALQTLLGAIPAIRSFQKAAGGDEWIVTLQGGEEAAADVLRKLVEGGVRVTDFRLRKSTLEDVFMNVTTGGLN
ncbi:MAG: ABC transporter ATP-binding protein [Kiritimatiellaeota bacterium]|nr:ABC transporter ATP-binding protein [Kiritimatiellota bacterium]